MTKYITLDLRLSTGCDQCDGKGVTGELYETAVGEPAGSIVILTDVICPKCRAGRPGTEVNYEPWDEDDAEQRALEDALAVDEDTDDWDDNEGQAPADPRATPGCPSCGGHGWNPVQAFGGEPPELVYLAVPCGCMEQHMTEVTPA